VRFNRLLVGSVAGALIVLPTAASADLVGHRDSTGDVRFYRADEGGYHVGEPLVAPGRRQGDIARIRVTHGTSSVRVYLKFRELNRAGRWHQHTFVLQGPSRKLWVYLSASPPRQSIEPVGPIDRIAASRRARASEVIGGWEGQLFVTHGSSHASHCRVKHKIDYPNDALVISVPRRCLANPRWIQVGERTSIQSRTEYFDNAYSSAGPLYGPSLPLGPRAYR